MQGTKINGKHIYPSDSQKLKECIIHSLINIKSTRTPLWVTELCACVESCGKVLGHFLVNPGRMNATISRQHLSRVKKIGWLMNKWQFCAAKLANSANYVSSTFGEGGGGNRKIMLVMTSYAKNYATTIYHSLVSSTPHPTALHHGGGMTLRVRPSIIFRCI